MNSLTLGTAKELLHKNMESKNLRRHCYAVGKVLRAYYDFYKQEGRDLEGLTADDWEIAGLLHDADYELTKEDWGRHTLVAVEWLKDYETKEAIVNALKSHNNKITGLREPQTLLEWTLECCDELTGFIVAVALMTPNKKLADVTSESVLKKFSQPSFARAVDREQIKQCESRVSVSVAKFVEISLKAMQKSSELLGL